MAHAEKLVGAHLSVNAVPPTLHCRLQQPEHLAQMMPSPQPCTCNTVLSRSCAYGLAAGTFNSGMPFMVDTLRHVLYGKHRSSMADASARADPQPRPRKLSLLHVLP